VKLGKQKTNGRELMKKYTILAMFMCIALLLTSCNTKGREENIADYDFWDDVIRQAQNTEVNLYMWGGSDSVNSYIDEYAAPSLKERYDITLKRIPLSDIRDIINRLLEEKQAGKETGSTDLLWINGENFKTAKENGILWKIPEGMPPNFINNTDFDSETIQKDFGESIEDYERPWGRSQMVFVYDMERTGGQPFDSVETLIEWARNNPGRFTYPAPPDFTGSAFVRQIFGEIDGYKTWPSDMDIKEFEPSAEAAMDYLETIDEFLWKDGGTYPESSGKLDQLFSSGEIDLTISYNPNHALNMARAGMFPESVRSFIMKKGTLSNTHYLAIAESSQNKPGALAVIEFMLSEEAQIEKLNPQSWGDGTVLSFKKLSPKGIESIDVILESDKTLTGEQLEKGSRSELSGGYVEYLERRWYEDVGKK
jgi:putative spermidine/putrescine transport system substrate-binding protein